MKLFFKPLDYYKDRDYVTRQKAKILYSFCIFSTLVVIVVLAYTFSGLTNLPFLFQLPILITIPGLLAAARLIRKGKLLVGTFLLLGITTAVIWFSMFMEIPEDPLLAIVPADTIVFLYGAIIFAILMGPKSRLFQILYIMGNILILFFFTGTLVQKLGLKNSLFIEYFIDNTLAILVTFILCSAVRTLMDRSLEMADSKILRNKELSQNLDRQMAARTQELVSAKEEAERNAGELEETQARLVESAKKAGMSELASSMLHNVGNILNSVISSGESIMKLAEQTNLERFTKAADMLRENMDNMEDFIHNDPKAKPLFEYILNLEEMLIKENKGISENAHRLNQKILLIKDIITAQQSYVSYKVKSEMIPLSLIAKEALMIQKEMIQSAAIQVESVFEDQQKARVHKAKVVHILINLIKNARDSFEEGGIFSRKITIHTYNDEKRIYLRFRDNGMGIPRENMNKIFTHGFTTKKTGNGFGLNSCANYMTEMKGSISVESPGTGQGASFLLSFPINE